MSISLYFLLLINISSADSNNLDSRYSTCLTHTKPDEFTNCMLKSRLRTEQCGKAQSFKCPPEATEQILDGVEASCKLMFRGLVSESRMVLSPASFENNSYPICKLPTFEFQFTDKTSFYMPVGHAKLGKNGKWVPPTPVIPIALRKHIKLSEIVVNEIDRRKPFLLGRGRHYEPARDIEICNPPPSRFQYHLEEDPRGLRDRMNNAFTESVKVFGLEKSEDFLRMDRHVIGSSRDFNYTVVSAFTPKNDLKICGRTIPKGTMLSLSTYLNERTTVCEIAADGVLFLLGVPNTENKAEPGKPPTKTLTCVPKAFFNSNFETVINKYISTAATGKPELPKKPVVDFDDCECMAKELEVEEWKD